MASRTGARPLRAVVVACVLAILTPALAAAQTDQTVTICQATGSATQPWVFTTIDARDLPEHLARGDYRASSIADCAGTSSAATSVPVGTPAPTPPATAVPTNTVAPTPARSAVQQSISGGIPLPDASVSQLVPASTTTPTAAAQRPTAASNVTVAGAQATPQAEVTTLPKSGGEPDRLGIVAILVAALVAGFGLRRLGREHA